MIEKAYDTMATYGALCCIAKGVLVHVVRHSVNSIKGSRSI